MGNDYSVSSDEKSKSAKKGQDYFIDIKFTKEILNNFACRNIKEITQFYLTQRIENLSFLAMSFLTHRLLKRFYPRATYNNRFNKGYNNALGVYWVPLDKTTLCRITVSNPDNDKNTSFSESLIQIMGLHVNEWCERIVQYTARVNERLISIDNKSIYYTVNDEDISKYFIPKQISEYYFEGKDTIVDAINNWKACKSIYNKFNQRYKFSILLYGDPGTGKTTFVNALGGLLKRTVRVYTNITYYTRAYNDSGRIILLDEIDAMMELHDKINIKFESNNAAMASSTQILLQTLDRLDEGVILVCTTNHIERLPEAMLRPGRFDIVMEVKMADREMAEEMVKKYNISTEILNEIGTYKDTGRYQQAAIEQRIIQEKIKEKLQGGI